mmetsp:Transcript_15074/g.12793  ORF Transcript_15074/g.12793 Transcript_15074/m.12793 type:complete len:140 (-) Transcript_15074:661-1080(-)
MKALDNSALLFTDEIENMIIPSILYFDGEKFHSSDSRASKGDTGSNMMFEGIKTLLGRQFKDPEVQEYSKKTQINIVEKGGFPFFNVFSSKDQESGLVSPEKLLSEHLKDLKVIAESNYIIPIHFNNVILTIPTYYSDR